MHRLLFFVLAFGFVPFCNFRLTEQPALAQQSSTPRMRLRLRVTLPDVRTDNKNVVMLGAQDAPEEERSADRGLLTRELIRQAILVAARDELGKKTLDQSLRDSFPRESEGGNYPINAVSVVFPDGRVRIIVYRAQGEKKAVLWAKEVRLEPSVDFFDKLVSEAEELSRGAFATVLKNAGFHGDGHRMFAAGKLSAEIEESLARLDTFSQLSAVQQLHQSITDNGESPERLAALARSYTLLGVLTEELWSPAHKAFKARGLLYAQRLVSRAATSARSYANRAFVRALIGRHASAVDDLARARELVQASPEQELPGWTPIVEAYCLGRGEQLVDFSVSGPNATLAMLLKLALQDKLNTAQATLADATRMLEAVPSCDRAIEELLKLQALGIQQQFSRQGLRSYLTT